MFECNEKKKHKRIKENFWFLVFDDEKFNETEEDFFVEFKMKKEIKEYWMAYNQTRTYIKR